MFTVNANLRKTKVKSGGSVTKTQGYAEKQGADLLLPGYGARPFAVPDGGWKYFEKFIR